ncbi:hypothetical protein [Zwartia sp.]|uniref:hypothetical protein n=1 Tax=Zwartia sp. TaxID=2978004 RepID=UPI003BB05437
MHLFKKILGVISFVWLGVIAQPSIAYAQNSAHTKQILASEVNPEKSLAVDLLTLNEDYDHTSKYAVNCTIYLLDYKLMSVRLTVLSTYKINACDPDLFAETTAASVKAQLAAYESIDRIVPVGPHIQMMDRNTSTVSHPYLSIGLLNFSQVASAYIGPLKVLSNLSNWRKLKNRTTTYSPVDMSESIDYVWLPGSVVFTLTSDQGEVFVMTHFTPNGSGVKIKGIELAAKELGQYLNLPAGWRYDFKTITKVLSVKRQEDVGQTSRRVFDEYSNAYLAVNAPIE